MKTLRYLFAVLISGMAVFAAAGQGNTLVLKNVTLIDGTGNAPQPEMSMLIKGDRIEKILRGNLAVPAGARVINLSGKTIMPALISAHAHVGVLKGTEISAENYTRENILRQLKRYEQYGVGAVLCMGTDRPLIFHGLRDSSQAGLLPGARYYSAGYGFSTPGGPPGGSWADHLFRPATPQQVPAEIDSLAKLHPTVVKIWVDDFGGHSVKMKPAIYQAIIREAHKHGLRVAAHLYYLEDASRLVDAGLDIIAHSIRDQEIDDGLLKKMKEKGVIYIPTLTRDEFTYIYADNPAWMRDPFFKASLEPGVYEMISSKDYQDKVRNSPDYRANKHAVEIAMKNLKKIFDAGVLVALGTDSGAEPVRAQGFSEQRELELMVEAGLTPLQAIETGTKNAAICLKINNRYGTLEPGKKADFIVLAENPEKDIRNTRKIESVWKNGIEVNQGSFIGKLKTRKTLPAEDKSGNEFKWIGGIAPIQIFAMKVFVTRIIPDAGLQLIKDAGLEIIQWTEKRNLKAGELIDHCKPVDGLLSAGGNRIDRAFLTACSHLKVISLHSAGYDKVDVPAATTLKIPVGNTPGVLSDATADIAFLLILATSRKAFYMHNTIISGEWGFFEPTANLGIEIRGKTLGIFGLGKIGFELAKCCSAAFGMKIIYHNRKRNGQAEKELGAVWVSFDELLKQSDVLSVNTALTEETKGKFNKSVFRKMKPSAIFINTARGAIHNEPDLIEALQQKLIWGAGLDVTDPEPMHPDNPLLQMPNVAVLPHIGSATVETRNAMAVIAAKNLIAGIRGERLPFVVNPEVYG